MECKMYLVHDRDDHVHDAGRDAALALSFLREHDECVEKMRGRIAVPVCAPCVSRFPDFPISRFRCAHRASPLPRPRHRRSHARRVAPCTRPRAYRARSSRTLHACEPRQRRTCSHIATRACTSTCKDGCSCHWPLADCRSARCMRIWRAHELQMLSTRASRGRACALLWADLS